MKCSWKERQAIITYSRIWANIGAIAVLICLSLVGILPIPLTVSLTMLGILLVTVFLVLSKSKMIKIPLG
ncbi:hypothetical protein F9U64_20510 [Gracilibacillus oryzae]|uniref:Uncharacterized protein n=1 Tax=Gracilibacillus oryzae TaxID=1672701 RepID=A0A7C8GQH3_9BACI|nr:hypothetical protein [Gracilibacillus oryzae]KAB8126143.1 hypothetical protein F9U64_20510 [Gracilibacillus oryzae]